MLLQIWMQLLNTWHERQRDIDVNWMATVFCYLIWKPDREENQLLKQSKNQQTDLQQTNCMGTIKWNKAIFYVRLEKTWLQWPVDINEMYTFGQASTTHQKMVTSVRKCCKDRNRGWCWLAVQGDSSSLQCWMWKWAKNYFITLYTWQFWTASSSWLLVGSQMTHRDLHLFLVRN
jgi:hypothetical protein